MKTSLRTVLLLGQKKNLNFIRMNGFGGLDLRIGFLDIRCVSGGGPDQFMKKQGRAETRSKFKNGTHQEKEGGTGGRSTNPDWAQRVVN